MSLPADVAAERKKQRSALRLYLRRALEQGPGTTSEIRDRIGDRPHRSEHWTHVDGHMVPSLDDEVRWTKFSAADIQRELVRLEKRGVTGRVVLTGWQAHLWYLVTPS